MEKLNCKNCGEEYEGNYCNNCGQRRIDKINWSFVIRSIGDAFELKKGILYNFKHFTLYPKTSISNYLNGKTRPFLNPVSYMFIALGLLFISIQLTERFGKDEIDEELLNQAEQIVYSVTILYPFIFSIILNLSIIDKKPNFLKGIIVALFLSGHVLIFLTLTRGILFIIDSINSIPSITGAYVLIVIGLYFNLTFSKGYFRIGYLKTLLRLFGSTIVFLITLFFIFAIFISIFSNPFSSLLPANSAGYDAGVLMRKITSLLTGF